jgi:hypothetical protein
MLRARLGTVTIPVKGGYLRDVTFRPAPRDLRASDADRERVVALLSDAMSDGRLTTEEHAERVRGAYSARTLGELSGLTTDLAAPSAQPLRLDGGRSVAGIFGKERREGRWVVPDSLTATAVLGEVVLDFREAMLQSRHITVYATAIGGKVHLLVPEGVAVQMSGTAVFGRKTGGTESRWPGETNLPSLSQGPPGMPVIEVRVFALWGQVRAHTPRRGRWRGLFGRRDRPGRLP